MNLSPNAGRFEHSAVRLIVEAICTACGPLSPAPAEGIVSVVLAQEHTAHTGHIVLLSGVTDLPEAAGEASFIAAIIPAQWGEA
jgi:hypothetical protein